MSENGYLLLMAKGNLQPLAEKFQEFEGFYTGIGYAFPSKSETFLRQILSSLPDARIIKIPMGNQQTFQSLRHTFKAAYFRERLLEIERQIASVREIQQMQELSEESIKALCLPEQMENSLLELLQEKQRLEKAIIWAQGIEKALTETKSPDFIQFICEKKTNFLLEDSREMPRLVNYQEGTHIKPFIRKGIVGMLVGSGGVGKTHALTQLALSLTTGAAWLGKYPVEQLGHVFLGLGENAEEDIHRLLRKVVQSFSHKEQDFLNRAPFVEASRRLAITSFTGMDATFIHQERPTPFYDQFLEALKSKEPKEGWACIILDPISRFLGL